MTDRVLVDVLEEAGRLKDSLLGARAIASLTDAQAQRALTACAQVIQVVREAANVNPAALWESVNGPLAEYMTWPNDMMLCPKCGFTKQGKKYWMAASAAGPERIKHECRCGYVLFTKTREASEAPVYDDDET